MTSDARGVSNRLDAPAAPLGSLDSQLRDAQAYLVEVVTTRFPFVSMLSRTAPASDEPRLRCAMSYLGGAFGSDRRGLDGDLRKVAVSVELSHLAMLHHDDVTAAGQSPSGDGDDVHVGNILAILSGDYLFAKACQLAAEVGGEVPGVIARTIAELCEGQVQLIAWRASSARPDCEQYVEVVRRRYGGLYGAAAFLGARLAGAESPVAVRLRRYGQALGTAVALRDELCELVGAGGDGPATEVRYALPVVHAAAISGRTGRELMRAGRDAGGLAGLLRDAGSLDYARSAVIAAVDRSRENLAGLDPVPSGTLRELLDMVVDSLPLTHAA